MTEKIWRVKLMNGTILNVYAYDPQDAVRKAISMGHVDDIYGVVA